MNQLYISLRSYYCSHQEDAWAQSTLGQGNLFTMGAISTAPGSETVYLQTGGAGAGRSPDGHTIPVNRYLVLDGKLSLPFMGEYKSSGLSGSWRSV